MTVTEPPTVVSDSSVALPPGETKYWLLLDDGQVEALAQGICLEPVVSQAHRLLAWKRDQRRRRAGGQRARTAGRKTR